MEIEVVCDCGRPLKAKAKHGQTLYPDPTRLVVQPCEWCLDNAFGDGKDEGIDEARDDIEEAHKDGYAEGFENGKLQAEREVAETAPPSWLESTWNTK